MLDDEPVTAETTDVSMRAARLDMLSAAVCKLRKLFDCCESCGDTELPMLEMDSGRCCGSLWRVRIIDNFRRMTLPSESKDLIGCCLCRCEPGGGVTPAREMDELECVGSGESDARDERLNGDKTLYATGGCAGECGGDDCDTVANGDCGSCGELARSRSRLPRDELAPSPSDAVAVAGVSAGVGKRVKISAGLLPRSANCACMSSLDRKSHVGGARPAHLECAMRLQWEHNTAPFFTGSIHTRQLTARCNQSLAMATRNISYENERTLAEGRFHKGVLAHVKEIGLRLRDFGNAAGRCAGKRKMARRTRKHHVIRTPTDASKLGNGR
jgi:hypothetical protein